MGLSAYLDRIGYTGPVRSDRPTLIALHRAHLLAIPYENLDIHLGRPLTLDEDRIFAKLVEARRGGWCYEAARLRRRGCRSSRADCDAAACAPGPLAWARDRPAAGTASAERGCARGFPLGREYRVFLYRRQVLARGYYWDEHADPSPLTIADAAALTSVATEAARRVDTPLVDVAQTVDGEWIVIEAGDAQFSGLSHVPVLELWAALQQALGSGQ